MQGNDIYAQFDTEAAQRILFFILYILLKWFGL